MKLTGEEKDKAIGLVKELVEIIDSDPSREGLKDTPSRVVKSFSEIYWGYGKDPKDFCTLFDCEDYDQVVSLRGIEFYSMCEHHMMPFVGQAHIAYLPKAGGNIIGLSKLARITEIYARRLQNQERITQQVAKAIEDLLEARGVGVILEARHFCMCARGVNKQTSVMRTSCMLGDFREASVKSEVMRLLLTPAQIV